MTFERALRGFAGHAVDTEGLEGRRLLARLYLRQTTLSLLFAFLSYMATLILIYGRFPWRLDAVWAAVTGALLLYGVYRRRRGGRLALTEVHARTLLRGAPYLCAAIGICWGITALALPYLGEGRQVALTVVAFALVVGATSTLSAVPKAAFAFIIPVSVPFLVAYLTAPTWTGVLLGILGIIFVLIMLVGLRLNSTGLLAEVEARDSSISARRAAETAQAALDASQMRWSEFSRSAEAFALFDRCGRLMLWNEPYRRLFRIESSALFVGARPKDYLSEDETCAEMRFLERQEQIPLDFHETVPRGGRWYRTTMAMLSTGEIAITHMDVTELKENEKKLIAMRDVLVAQRNRAESANQAKSNFLAKMSHELRTPLNAVIGFAELIVQDHDRGRADAKRHSGYARLISDSGRHLLAIVDDLLDLTRIETGQLTLRESEVDLGEMMRSARLLVEGRGHDRRIAFREAFPEVPLIVWADRRLLSQAIINLMENSVKFCGDDPVIELAVTGGNGTEGAELNVRDNGIGIPEGLFEQVQAPFFQVEDSETRRYGGVGLGLALVREFAAMHGGGLKLSRREPAGLEVRLCLPQERVVG